MAINLEAWSIRLHDGCTVDTGTKRRVLLGKSVVGSLSFWYRNLERVTVFNNLHFIKIDNYSYTLYWPEVQINGALVIKTLNLYHPFSSLNSSKPPHCKCRTNNI